MSLERSRIVDALVLQVKFTRELVFVLEHAFFDTEPRYFRDGYGRNDETCENSPSISSNQGGYRGNGDEHVVHKNAITDLSDVRKRAPTKPV